MKSKTVSPFKKNHADLVASQSINWVKVEKRNISSATDEVRVSFVKSGSGKNLAIAINIGGEIAEQLKWKEKDKLCFYLNPNDPHHIKIVKSDIDGYSLSKSGTYNYHCGFVWSATKQSIEHLGKVFYEIMPNLTLEIKIK